MPATYRIKYTVAIVCRKSHARYGLTGELDADTRYDISLDYSIADKSATRDSHVAHLEWVDVPADVAAAVQKSLAQNLESVEGLEGEDLNEQDADHCVQVLAVAALRVYEQFAFSAQQRIDAEQAVIEALQHDEQAEAAPQEHAEVTPDPATDARIDGPATTPPKPSADTPIPEVSTEVIPEVSPEAPAQ